MANMDDGVLLTLRSAMNLKRLAEAELRACKNLRNHLAKGSVRRHEANYIPPLPVQFVNNASETAPAYGVMRVTGVNSAGRVEVAKPNTTLQRLYLVNGHKDVAAGKTGKGTWLTEFGHGKQFKYVLYNTSSGTPAYGECWGPKNGQWSLEKYRYGFTIIGGNTGTGSEARTVCLQQLVNEFRGVTDSSVAKDATGTVSIYDGNKVDTTDNMSSVMQDFATTVASGKDVFVRWQGGKWAMTAAEC